jgi:DNA-binding MarR family transcriptional regulator
MPLLMLKDLPRYDCLIRAAERCPTLQPSACDAFLNLLRTGDDVFAVVHRFLSGHDISQGRFTVLMLLGMCGEEEGPATPATLAGEAGVTRATMTGLIDTLEKDRLVAREPDPDDRRTIHVRLTDEGRALLEGILPDYFQCVADILRPLSDLERKQFVRLLQKIQTGLVENSKFEARNSKPDSGMGASKQSHPATAGTNSSNF